MKDILEGNGIQLEESPESKLAVDAQFILKNYLQKHASNLFSSALSPSALETLAENAFQQMELSLDSSKPHSYELKINPPPVLEEVQGLQGKQHHLPFLYMAVLTLPPQYRALPIIALSQKENKEQPGKKEDPDFYLPTTSEVVTVAQQYGVRVPREVIEALAELGKRWKEIFFCKTRVPHSLPPLLPLSPKQEAESPKYEIPSRGENGYYTCIDLIKEEYLNKNSYLEENNLENKIINSGYIFNNNKKIILENYLKKNKNIYYK